LNMLYDMMSIYIICFYLYELICIRNLFYLCILHSKIIDQSCDEYLYTANKIGWPKKLEINIKKSLLTVLSQKMLPKQIKKCNLFLTVISNKTLLKIFANDF
jgi:hypothetical protein